MKNFYLIAAFLLPFSALAQQEYFNPDNKKEGLEYYKNRIYQGCSDLKEKQDPISTAEMKKIVNSSLKIIEENFSRSLGENPKVHAALKKDLTGLVNDPTCQKEGNDCRARLMGYSIYYYQQFRADIPGCQNYKKTPPMEKGYSTQCEIELKYRQSTLQGVHSTNYGMPGPGTYKKELVAVKNNTTIQLFSTVMHKDRINLHICNSVQSGIVHQYALDIDDPGDYWVGLDPEYDPKKNIPKECVDEKVTLYSEFVPTSFDEGRSTIGLAEVEPIKKKITDFIKNNPQMIVTDVSVTSSSSKTPFHTVVGGKKIIDPKSNDKNLSLAKDRAAFAEKILGDLKKSSSSFEKVTFASKAELAGPEFDPMDLNDRFVTKMTPGYAERVQSMFEKNKEVFQKQALKDSPQDLMMDEKKFVNLYQAKFKPFQGFRIQISGYKKEEMKCLELSEGSDSKSDGASKQ